MVDSQRYKRLYESRKISVQKAVRMIRHGDTVFCSWGAAQPRAFLDALASRGGIGGIKVITGMTVLPSALEVMLFRSKSRQVLPHNGISLVSIQPGPVDLALIEVNALDILPVRSTDITSSLEQLDKLSAVVIASPGMDEEGNIGLGTNVDATLELLSAAEERGAIVIVEANSRLPWTYGQTTFPVQVVDYVIEADYLPPQFAPEYATQVTESLGGWLSEIVPDGATLHVAPTPLTMSAAKHLGAKKHLGVHSDFIGDIFIDLFDKGAITNSHKGHMDGKWVGTYLLGSQKLYDMAADNPDIELYPASFVCEPAVIARHNKMTSIIQADMVDLTGQAGCTPGQGGRFPGWGESVFHKVASNSPGGRGIILVSSLQPESGTSSIVPVLPASCMVLCSAHDVDTIVTEYGVARLKGKTLFDRVGQLISIAHPKVRERLLAEATELGFL